MPLTSRYASMSTDPHEHFTLLSLTALLMMMIGAVGRRSAQHRCNAFRSADHLGRHDLQGVGCAGLRATLD